MLAAAFDEANQPAGNLEGEGEGNIPDLSAAYSIDLMPFKDETGSAYRISGHILNNGPARWNDQHRIAVRHFRTHAGDHVPDLEFRGVLGHASVLPGEETPFEIVIDSALLGRGLAVCELDMVHEGHYWYAERGAPSIDVPVRGFRNPGARADAAVQLSRLARGGSASERSKIAVLQDVLQQFDFGAYTQIQMLRRLHGRSGKPVRPPIVSSRAVLAALGREPGADAKRAAFLLSFAVKNNVPVRLPEDICGLVEAFVKLAREGSGTTFRGSTPPLPLDLVRWLAGRALPVELARNPLSRSMLAVMGDRTSINLNRLDEFIELAWTYATAVMIDGNLSADLFPEAVLNHLAVSAQTNDPEKVVPEITGFMRRVFNDTPEYQERYDLDSESGRCAFAFDLLLLGMENEARRTLLGHDMLDWLTQPVGPGIAASPFEILACANAGDHHVVDFAGSDTLDPDLARLRRAFDWLPDAPALETWPLRVIGRHASQSGLGANMRMSLEVFDTLAIASEIVDTDLDVVVPPKRDGGFARAIDLFHLNLDDVPTLVSRYTAPGRQVPYRIGFALWESSVMPEQHRAGGDLMDELWVPTDYLERVYREAGFTNVHVVGKAIDVSVRAPFARGELDIPDDVFLFVTSFDIDSWVERKNPSAAVEAFRRAFPTERNVRLVVKTTGIFAHPGDRTRQVARVLAAADMDDRIILVNERLSFERYLGLIGMADAVVSSHRSEGFGYLPAYAMMMGIPAIVTDHSGTEDFCTSETSFPVRSRLVPIPAGDFVYDAPGALWADVDIDALAEAMRVVRSDDVERDRRAAAGKALVEAVYSYEAMADRYRQRLDAIAGRWAAHPN